MKSYLFFYSQTNTWQPSDVGNVESYSGGMILQAIWMFV